MAQRNYPEDQRTDTLTYHLTVLTQAVTLAVVHLDTLMQEPASPTRERRIAEILQALTRVNEKAMRLGLRKSVRGIVHEQQQVEARVAQQCQDTTSSPL
jgi:hypothetical protein